MSKALLPVPLAVTLGGLLAAGGALGDSETIDEIVVTGSRIARDEFSSSAPLSVFDQQALINSGVVSVDEFLKEAPSFTGFQHGTSTNNGNIGLKAVSLRGLGTKRTLVLINGRRQVGSFIGGSDDVGAVDLNTIPDALIKRVEVLKDGASTIYGSDALAGVVNVILKDEFEGVEVRAGYGAATRNQDAANYGYSATLGVANERGRAVIGVEFSEQEELLQAERDWALFDFHPVLVDGVFVPMAGGSSNSRRIRSTGFNAAGNAALAAAGFSPGQQFIVDAETGQPRPFTTGDTYNYAPVNALITPNERRQLSGMGSHDLTDSATLFVEASYTRRTSHQRLAPDASFAVNSSISTPNHGVQWNDFVPASNPGNPFGNHPDNPYGISGQNVRINRRFEESGGRLFQQSVDTYRIVAGLSGDIGGGLSWELAYTRADNEDSEEVLNYGRYDRWAILVDPAACGAVPDCVTATGGTGYLDPFGEFGTIPQSVFDYLTAGSLKNLRLNDMQVWSFTLNGDFGGRFMLPGGAPAWSAGYERREESARFVPDEFVAEGLTTSGSASPLEGAFQVDELYAEAYLPVRDNFSVDASLRYSDYDTVGGTTNYRVGANLALTSELDLRATWSSGFRAPNVVELFGGDQTTFPIVEDPCEFFDRRPDPDGNLARNCADAGFGPGFEWGFQYQALYTATAPPPGTLKPEESNTHTAGLVWSPEFLTGLAVGADYWHIKVAGFIDVPPYNSLMRNCMYAADQSAEPACGFFVGGSGHVAAVPDDAIAPLANLGLVETSGIDVNLNYTRELRLWLFESLDFTLASTLLLNYNESFPATGRNDRSGRVQGFQAYPEYKTTANVTLNARNWSITLNSRHISGMDDFLRPAHLTDDARAEAMWYNDILVNYDFGERAAITVGIDNIFDEDPPLYHSAANADTEPGTYDTIGRRLFTTVIVRF